MKNKLLKSWVLIILMFISSNCWAGIYRFHNVVENFDSIVSLLKSQQAIIAQEYEKFENGEYIIYDFIVSADSSEKLLKSYGFSLGHIVEFQTEATNGNTHNQYVQNNPVETVKYGKKYSKTMTFGDAKAKQKFNLQRIHEAENAGRKHVFAVTWHKKGRKLEGKLCHFVNTENDLSNNIHGKPQNTADFLMLLNHFRTAFVQLSKMPDTYNDKLLVQTGLVNKILKLCRAYGYLMDQEERTLCSQAIYDMCQDVNDTFLRTTLTIAGKALEKGEFSTVP